VHSPAPDDLTARARIRHSAFELMATQGVRSATLRSIAKAAGVSPALVIHHYGSKQGVVEAVEEWVQILLRSSTADEGASSDPAEANARRSAAFEQLLTATPLLRSWQLAGFKVPRSLIVVDALERTPAGKPDYKWARELAKNKATEAASA
jgi:AcrR family transcriptional regulator